MSILSDYSAKAIAFIRERKRAYQLAFSIKAKEKLPRVAYIRIFGAPAGQMVLQDLAVFCRAAETCVIPNDRDRTLILEGRREVFIRIADHLNLNVEQLYALYAGRNINISKRVDEDGDE